MSKNFYWQKDLSNKIEQADIFLDLPFLDIISVKVQAIEAKDGEFKYKEIDLDDYSPPDDGSILNNVIANLELKPGIVISQNCDNLRRDHISFCEIKNLSKIENNFVQMQPGKRIKYLTKEYKHKETYFYLPEEDGIFEDKMAVDFSRIYQIQRVVLEKILKKRIASLSEIPLEHFRIKIANYFKRYAYDSWYVLRKEEYISYYEKHKGDLPDCELKLIKPYPWQE